MTRNVARGRHRRTAVAAVVLTPAVLFMAAVALGVHADGRPLMILYNHTPDTARLTMRNESVGPKSLPPGGTAEMPGLDLFRLCVAMAGRSWCYNPDLIVAIGPAPGFGFERGLLVRTPTFRAQLEPDGRVFALRADQRFPAAALPSQPRGYPLEPH